MSAVAPPLPSWLDLTGRTAVVTGAGSPTGIGFASARALGQLGAAVVLTATTGRVHERAAELAAEGIEAVGVVGDLTVEDDVAALAAAAVSRASSGPVGVPRGVDVLVNNAGMTSLASPGLQTESGHVLDLDPEAWNASLRRNLDTAFLATRAFLPAMVARGWGRIVNVASVTGPVMAMRGEAAYAAAKAGMVGLTRAVALDVGPDGVTCNAVAPGWIATGSQTDDEHRQSQATPLGRSADPAEVAAAVAWLCTPGAGYLTGQCVVVDGGNSIAEQRA